MEQTLSRVIEGLREKLRHNAVAMQIPIGLEENHVGVVDLITMKAIYFEGDNGENIREDEIPAELLEDAKKYRQELIAAAADFDDVLGEKFLMEEAPTEDEIRTAVRKGTLSLKMTPVFCGSAYKNRGVQTLLDNVRSYLPNPLESVNEALDQDQDEKAVEVIPDPDKPLVALAFKP